MQRVTFYEDYSYEKFVGAYLPCSGVKTSNITGTNGANSNVSVKSTTENSIEYRFVPGVFLKMIADAWFDENGRYVLVIEEINRANAASVFGDFFQLLDRDSAGISEYAVSLPEDMRDRLQKYLWEKGKEKYSGDDLNNYRGWLNNWLDNFKLPGNLYLWATMNSADQGVYPMDAAFKRRWSYLYKSVQSEQRTVPIHIRWKDNKGYVQTKDLPWNILQTAINTVMENSGNIEEDRLIGPWFFKETEIDQINAFTDADAEKRNSLPDPLTNKLFQYLRQDVFRNNPGQLFKDGYHTMSQIREGMINGIGLNDILQIDDVKIKVANEAGEAVEKKISEVLKDLPITAAQDSAADTGNQADTPADSSAPDQNS